MPCTPARVWAAMQGGPSRRNDAPPRCRGGRRSSPTRGEPFVTATVVRAQRPTSVEAGNVALVLGDGTIEGFVGGDCAEHSVRAYALQAIESGEPVLLRILPFARATPVRPATRSRARTGAVTVQNPCLSGGAIEVFLEPVLPAPRVLVEGDTPIADALAADRRGARARRWSPWTAATSSRGRGDLALVVAAHGRDELPRAAPRPRGGPALRRPRGQPQARRRRDRRAARRRRGRGAARAHRHAGRARHRRAHAGRDRALDPRPGSCGAPRRGRAPRAGRRAGPRRPSRRRPDLRDDRRRRARARRRSSTTARRSTSAARAARPRSRRSSEHAVAD